MLKQFLTAGIMAIAVSGCASVGTPSETISPVIQANQLVGQESKQFDVAFAKNPYPEVTSVYFEPMDLTNVTIIQPDSSTSITSRVNRDWVLTDRDVEWLQEAYAKSVENSFSASNITVAATADEADAVVSADLTRIKPTAPKDDSSRSPGSRYYTKYSGEMDVRFTVVQGTETILVIEDRRDAGFDTGTASMNNRTSVQFDVRNLFNRWAIRLGKQMEVLAEPGA
ncbi:DUF3313 family protein [Umboniibacter marinipuniceus]|uniref:Uncharacterized protein DUF3313 n=1 Tax=Umboniibacter marinipuniceus TaxID=569599 RepID=A0A3M0AIL8_9GAMM|nr:DUF3313 family protein [Umboniibacter marinipuniceus]RMA82558.1 uncharacterized protein DUF3313 [Umboniibacter marinipuniceus]